MSFHQIARVTISAAACLCVAGGGARAETLDQAWQAAVVADRQLQAHLARSGAAHEQLLAARALRHPSVHFQGLYTVRDSDRAFLTSPPVGLGLPSRSPYMQAEGFAYEATVKLPLYTHYETSYRISAAEADQVAAGLEVPRRQLDLKMSVAESFVGVLNADRVVEVAAGNVRSLDSHVRDTVKRHENNLVPRNDALAAQVELSSARQRAIRARNQADKARAAYNRLLGRPLTAPVALDDPIVPTNDESVESLTARALATRPEIARLRARAEALECQAAATRASTGPRVELQGGHTYQENRFQDPEAIGQASIVLMWNGLDGGRTRHRALAESSEAAALFHQLEDFESIVALDVRRVWLDQQETQARTSVAREALERSVENLRVAQERYRTGLGTNTDVLVAEALRVNSYHNYYTALYDAVLATLRLRYVTGEM